ncbi:MAG TPA: hypothetical protein VNA20_11815 [Frankiaceae bacterium]|nr:hypothetical protein [Frankiaceae bacterium]
MALVVLGGALLAVPGAGAAPPASGGAAVSPARHDTSRPLRDLVPPPATAPPLALDPATDQLVGRVVPVPDPVLQAATPGPARLRVVHSYEGLGAGYPGFSSAALPPDPAGAAGRTQYVQWINGALLVLDKATGAALLGPVPGNTLWAGFGGNCEARDAGDPIVSYDRFADRWVLQQFVGVTEPYGQCVAVSTTPDATGAWHRYGFTYAALNDYPKVGVWSHSYVTTYEMFGAAELGPKVCAMNRAAMLAGAATTQQCFQLPAGSRLVLPADAEGPVPPAPAADVPLVALGTDALLRYALHVDWANPALSALSGPSPLAVAPFTMACGPLYDVASRNAASCIPQPDQPFGVGPVGLDPMSDRPMFRLAWRSFPGHDAMVVTHAVDVPLPVVSGVRWYELRSAGGPWAVHQQGTYAPGGTARWMSSAAMDRDGGIAVGYSRSGTTTYPGLAVAGRLAGDPPGTLSAETVVAAGAGSQLGASALGRWGDYSSMTVDPVDDCTFWYTAEYQSATGTFTWSTRIVAVRLPTCP